MLHELIKQRLWNLCRYQLNQLSLFTVFLLQYVPYSNPNRNNYTGKEGVRWNRRWKVFWINELPSKLTWIAEIWRFVKICIGLKQFIYVGNLKFARYRHAIKKRTAQIGFCFYVSTAVRGKLYIWISYWQMRWSPYSVSGHHCLTGKKQWNFRYCYQPLGLDWTKPSKTNTHCFQLLKLCQ